MSQLNNLQEKGSRDYTALMNKYKTETEENTNLQTKIAQVETDTSALKEHITSLEKQLALKEGSLSLSNSNLASKSEEIDQLK